MGNDRENHQYSLQLRLKQSFYDPLSVGLLKYSQNKSCKILTPCYATKFHTWYILRHHSRSRQSYFQSKTAYLTSNITLNDHDNIVSIWLRARELCSCSKIAATLSNKQCYRNQYSWSKICVSRFMLGIVKRISYDIWAIKTTCQRWISFCNVFSKLNEILSYKYLISSAHDSRYSAWVYRLTSRFLGRVTEGRVMWGHFWIRKQFKTISKFHLNIMSIWNTRPPNRDPYVAPRRG